MGRETIGEVWDGLEYPQKGSRRVGGPSRRSRASRGKLGEVRDGTRDFPGGPGWVVGPLWTSGTVRGHSGWSRTSRGPSGWFGTSRETLGKVLDGSEDPQGGSG